MGDRFFCFQPVCLQTERKTHDDVCVRSIDNAVAVYVACEIGLNEVQRHTHSDVCVRSVDNAVAVDIAGNAGLGILD